MKLHLPSGLRRALLACLAAVALPAVSVPYTLASASGITALYFLASQQALAITDPHNWGNPVPAALVDSEGSPNTATTDTDYTVEGDKSYVFTTNGGDVDIRLSSENSAASQPITISLEGAFAEVWITCQSARVRVGTTQQFNANIGKLYVGGGAQLWFNTVNLSLNTELHLGSTTFAPGWGNNPQLDHAALALENTTLTTTGNLVLEEDAQIGFTGTSQLTVGGLTGGADAVRTLTLAGGNNPNMTLFKEGGANVRGKMKIDGSLTMGGEVTLVQNSQLDITGALTSDSLTKLTLSTGSKLSAGVSGTLAIAELSIDGEATLKLADDTHLSFSSLSGSGTLTLDLSDITGNLDGYRLFEGSIASWYSEWEDRITIAGTTGQFTLSEDGTLAIGGLKWTGSGAAVTLGDTVSGEGWSEESAPVDADTDVVLKGTSGSEVNVTVDGGDDSKVEMSSLTIGGGESSATYAFTTAGSGQTLSVDDMLAVYADTSFDQNVNLTTGEEATITVGEGVTMSVQGDLTLGTDATVQLGKGATLGYTFSTSKSFIGLLGKLSGPSSGSARLELLGSEDLGITVNNTDYIGLSKDKGIIGLYKETGKLCIFISENNRAGDLNVISGAIDVANLEIKGPYGGLMSLELQSGGTVHGDLSLIESGGLFLGGGSCGVWNFEHRL